MARVVEGGDAIQEPTAKNLKLDCDVQANAESIHTLLNDFSEFQQKRVLNDNSQRKTVCVEGTFSNRPGTAIVLLEKKPFNDEELKNTFGPSCVLQKEFSNDIYGFYECFPNVKCNGFKTTVIYPATEKHIRKYEAQNIYLIEETPELYKSVTLPHLEKERFSLKWVTNILEHKSETDRVIFEDSDPEIGFVLLPDLKWDRKQVEDLYLLAIVRQTGIKSLRDLKSCHVPLLKNIRDKGINVIKETYNISSSQLRIFIHYQPSFYHLHVHFTYLNYEAPGIYAEKSHILSSIINNIELMPDYYQKATLPFVVKETENLFVEYEKRGMVRKH